MTPYDSLFKSYLYLDLPEPSNDSYHESSLFLAIILTNHDSQQLLLDTGLRYIRGPSLATYSPV